MPGELTKVSVTGSPLDEEAWISKELLVLSWLGMAGKLIS